MHSIVNVFTQAFSCLEFVLIGGVITKQAEADEDMSLKQRLVLAGGSAMTEASELVDNEIISGAMEVAGKNEVCGQINVFQV